MTDQKLRPANHRQRTSSVPPTRPPAVAPTPRRSAHHRRPFSADPVLGAPFLVRVHAGTCPNRKIGDVGASHDTTREARHERTSASAPAFDFGPLWWEGRSLPPSPHDDEECASASSRAGFGGAPSHPFPPTGWLGRPKPPVRVRARLDARVVTTPGASCPNPARGLGTDAHLSFPFSKFSVIFKNPHGHGWADLLG